MLDGINLKFDMDQLQSQKEKLKPFLKNYLSNKGADITPFKETVRHIVSEQQVRKSKIEYGLVTLQLPMMTPMELKREQIPVGLLIDFIMASASCFPAFPVYKIEEKSYIDGRYYDNLPINFAIKLGATELVVIDLNYGSRTHKEDAMKPNIEYINPSWNLGPFLNFDHETMMRNKQLGYLDTLKHFQKLTGFKYAFEKTNHYTKLGRTFAQNIAKLESYIPVKNKTLVVNLIPKHVITDIIKKEIYTENLTYQDYAIRGLELVMELLDMDPIKIYQVKTIKKEIMMIFDEVDDQAYEAFLKNLQAMKLPKIYKFLKAIDSVDLVKYFTKLIRSSNSHETLWYATLMPKELTASLFLAILLEK